MAACGVQEQAEFFFGRNELATIYFRHLIDPNAFAGPPNPGHYAIADLMLVRGLVARTLVDNAIDGDTTAVRECFDRMDGKATQGVDATGQVRGDITVTWVRPAY